MENTDRTGRSAHLCWEPSYIYCASKCKQTKEQGSENYLYIFLPFCDIIFSFFLFFCQNANKSGSNCALICCNLSKKHELGLYKTQKGEHFLKFLQGATVQGLGDRHPNTIELANWLVHILCDLKTNMT